MTETVFWCGTAAGPWANPANAQGAHDSLCATLSQSDIGPAGAILAFSNFNVDLPEGAVLSKVYFGLHAAYCSICGLGAGDLSYYIFHGADGKGYPVPQQNKNSMACAADPINCESENLVAMFSVAELESGSFNFYAHALVGQHNFPWHTHFFGVDHAWIRIVYHVGPGGSGSSFAFASFLSD